MADAGTAPGSEVTVGVETGDVRGATGRASQLAIDAVAWRGGGTVRVLAGTDTLVDSLHLRPGVRLAGEPGKTILQRGGPLSWSPLAVDADVGERQITPMHPERFSSGMGVCRWDRQNGWADAALPLTVTRVVRRLHCLTAARRLPGNARWPLDPAFQGTV